MLKVLKADIEDATQIAKCAREAYSNEIRKYCDDKAQNNYPSTKCVIEDIRQYDYYKVVLDGEIIGGIYLVLVNERTLRIEDFCISPVNQNKGYGAEILIQLERMKRHIKVWTLVTPLYSISNQRFYEKLGYREVGVDKEDGVDVIRYEKIIFAHGERITLEYARVEDKKLVYDMLVSPEVINLMFDEKHPAPTWLEFSQEPDSLFSGIPNEDGSYLLIKVKGEVIGSICYAQNNGNIRSVELDIWISTVINIGKGYGSEAIKLVIECLNSYYNTRTFIIRPWIKNDIAIKAYKKCGFEEIESFKASDYYSDEIISQYGDGDYGIDETVNLIYRIQ